jgi:hypothetical protein
MSRRLLYRLFVDFAANHHHHKFSLFNPLHGFS